MYVPLKRLSQQTEPDVSWQLKAMENHQVLLLEAGGTNINPNHQIYGARLWILATALGYNWDYKTVPQIEEDMGN